MPYKHFWAGVGVVLGPFKGGSATKTKRKRPQKQLWRGYHVALADGNTNPEWETGHSAPKSRQMAPGRGKIKRSAPKSRKKAPEGGKTCRSAPKTRQMAPRCLAYI